MKKQEKKMIGILILVSVVIITIIFFATRSKKEGSPVVKEQGQNEVKEEFVQVMEDGSKLNISSKLSEIKSVNGLEIGNIQLTMRNGQTLLTAQVKNNTGKDIGITEMDITLLDKQGNEIVTIGGIIGDTKAGATTKLIAETTLDFANAYDFKVVIL